jgi:trehalose/maltose hydrolase-like predicted phosphorylase
VITLCNQRLATHPRLPPAWGALELRLRFCGSRVRLRVEPHGFEVAAEAQIDVEVGGDKFSVGPAACEFRRKGTRWEVST